MVVRMVEVHETARHSGEGSPPFSLREVFVNPEHVACLREDLAMGKKLHSGLLPEELDSRQRFTKIHLNRGLSGIDLVVVGDPKTIQNKLTGQILLKG